jgi:hypothetical protein
MTDNGSTAPGDFKPLDEGISRAARVTMAGFMPQAYWDAIRLARLVRVLAVYFGASFVALEAVGLFVEQLGLRDWVPRRTFRGAPV